MSRSTKPRAFVLMALLCVALLALLTVVQVAHMHPAQSDADHCPLCVVLHTAAPAVASALVVTMVAMGSAAPMAAVRRAVPRPWHPTLFNRPPPFLR